RQHPRFLHQIGEFDFAPADPCVLLAGDYNVSVAKQQLEAPLVRKGTQPTGDQKIDFALAQGCEQHFPRPYNHAKYEPRQTPGQSLDDGRYEACGQYWIASDAHVARCWIGEEFNVLHPLPQLVEYSDPALE